MIRFLLLFLCCGALCAENIIQCVANFPINPATYTHILQEHGYDGKVVLIDMKEYGEGLLKKKKSWRQFFTRVTVPENVVKIVFFNLDPKIAKKYDLSKLPKEKLVLFMWEPKTVLEGMYHPQIQECFSQIYTWDDSLVDGKTYFKFHYPVLQGMIDPVPSFKEKKLCTCVASNLSSGDAKELYSARKEVIRFFEQIGERGFEFYGRGWDAAEYPSYRGAIANKLATIKNYRFSICYENTHGTKGYITEKIFDCFAAGTIPIYWGASNVEEYIPQECFIDKRRFSSLHELYRFLQEMTEDEYSNYLTRIRNFLSSDTAKKFTLEQLQENFYQAIVR